jgi:hypothetical protein
MIAEQNHIIISIGIESKFRFALFHSRYLEIGGRIHEERKLTLFTAAVEVWIFLPDFVIRVIRCTYFVLVHKLPSFPVLNHHRSFCAGTLEQAYQW